MQSRYCQTVATAALASLCPPPGSPSRPATLLHAVPVRALAVVQCNHWSTPRGNGPGWKHYKCLYCQWYLHIWCFTSLQAVSLQLLVLDFLLEQLTEQGNETLVYAAAAGDGGGCGSQCLPPVPCYCCYCCLKHHIHGQLGFNRDPAAVDALLVTVLCACEAWYNPGSCLQAQTEPEHDLATPHSIYCCPELTTSKSPRHKPIPSDLIARNAVCLALKVCA
jgi:hypothetical protein